MAYSRSAFNPRYRESGVAGGIRTAIRFLVDVFGAYRALPNMTQLPDGSVWLKIREGAWSNPRPHLGDENPFTSDEAREYRSELALELLDDEVHHFMVFLLKKTEKGQDMTFKGQFETRMISAFTRGFAMAIDNLDDLQRSR